jgi:AcrR family transcriptional regulator
MARTRSDIAPRIVAAARLRFLHEGVDGASLRAIAADAHTSIGMIYYYYPTKDELFFAVVEDTYARILEDVTRALQPDAPVPERLRRLYRRIGTLSERETLTVRLILREALVSSQRLRRLFERFSRGHIPLVLAALADGVRDGAIRDDLHPLVGLLVTFAVGVVPQLVLRHATHRLPVKAPPADAVLTDQLVDVLFRGISASPARSSPRAAPSRSRPVSTRGPGRRTPRSSSARRRG